MANENQQPTFKHNEHLMESDFQLDKSTDFMACHNPDRSEVKKKVESMPKYSANDSVLSAFTTLLTDEMLDKIINLAVAEKRRRRLLNPANKKKTKYCQVRLCMNNKCLENAFC